MGFLRWLGQVTLAFAAVGLATLAFAIVLGGAEGLGGPVAALALLALLGWWMRDNR